MSLLKSQQVSRREEREPCSEEGTEEDVGSDSGRCDHEIGVDDECCIYRNEGYNWFPEQEFERQEEMLMQDVVEVDHFFFAGMLDCEIAGLFSD